MHNSTPDSNIKTLSEIYADPIRLERLGLYFDRVSELNKSTNNFARILDAVGPRMASDLLAESEELTGSRSWPKESAVVTVDYLESPEHGLLEAFDVVQIALNNADMDCGYGADQLVSYIDYLNIVAIEEKMTTLLAAGQYADAKRLSNRWEEFVKLLALQVDAWDPGGQDHNQRQAVINAVDSAVSFNVDPRLNLESRITNYAISDFCNQLFNDINRNGLPEDVLVYLDYVKEGVKHNLIEAESKAVVGRYPEREFGVLKSVGIKAIGYCHDQPNWLNPETESMLWDISRMASSYLNIDGKFSH